MEDEGEFATEQPDALSDCIGERAPSLPQPPSVAVDNEPATEARNEESQHPLPSPNFVYIKSPQVFCCSMSDIHFLIINLKDVSVEINAIQVHKPLFEFAVFLPDYVFVPGFNDYMTESKQSTTDEAKTDSKEQESVNELSCLPFAVWYLDKSKLAVIYLDLADIMPYVEIKPAQQLVPADKNLFDLFIRKELLPKIVRQMNQLSPNYHVKYFPFFWHICSMDNLIGNKQSLFKGSGRHLTIQLLNTDTWIPSTLIACAIELLQGKFGQACYCRKLDFCNKEPVWMNVNIMDWAWGKPRSSEQVTITQLAFSGDRRPLSTFQLAQILNVAIDQLKSLTSYPPTSTAQSKISIRCRVPHKSKHKLKICKASLQRSVGPHKFEQPIGHVKNPSHLKNLAQAYEILAAKPTAPNSILLPPCAIVDRGQTTCHSSQDVTFKIIGAQCKETGAIKNMISFSYKGRTLSYTEDDLNLCKKNKGCIKNNNHPSQCICAPGVPPSAFSIYSKTNDDKLHEMILQSRMQNAGYDRMNQDTHKNISQEKMVQEIIKTNSGDEPNNNCPKESDKDKESHKNEKSKKESSVKKGRKKSKK